MILSREFRRKCTYRAREVAELFKARKRDAYRYDKVERDETRLRGKKSRESFVSRKGEES